MVWNMNGRFLVSLVMWVFIPLEISWCVNIVKIWFFEMKCREVHGFCYAFFIAHISVFHYYGKKLALHNGPKLYTCVFMKTTGWKMKIFQKTQLQWPDWGNLFPLIAFKHVVGTCPLLFIQTLGGNLVRLGVDFTKIVKNMKNQDFSKKI